MQVQNGFFDVVNAKRLTNMRKLGEVKIAIWVLDEFLKGVLEQVRVLVNT